MEPFDELLTMAESAHGHLCAGQILGVRLAMLGCERLGIDEPRGRDRKRLVTFVEIDRCATDAIAVVTGCRLGKRAIKFRDWGKMAATFVDLASPLHHKTIHPSTKPSASPPSNPQGSAPATLYPADRKQEPAADARLPRTPRRRPLHRRVGRVPIHPARCPATKRPASPAHSAAKASTTTASSSGTADASATHARARTNATTSRYRSPQITLDTAHGTLVTKSRADYPSAH